MRTGIKIYQHQYPKRRLLLAESCFFQNFVCKVEFQLYSVGYPVFKKNDYLIASVTARKQ